MVQNGAVHYFFLFFQQVRRNVILCWQCLPQRQQELDLPVFFKVRNVLIKKKYRLHLLIFLSALKDSSLGNTNAIMNSSPLFVMIIGVIFLREKFTITRRISFVTLIAGCVLIAIPKSDITSSLSFKVLKFEILHLHQGVKGWWLKNSLSSGP